MQGGQFLIHGALHYPLNGKALGDPIADAQNCRWTFENDLPFENGDAIVIPSVGGTVEFAESGWVITHGVEFRSK
jgi:hypothetical protein